MAVRDSITMTINIVADFVTAIDCTCVRAVLASRVSYSFAYVFLILLGLLCV